QYQTFKMDLSSAIDEMSEEALSQAILFLCRKQSNLRDAVYQKSDRSSNHDDDDDDSMSLCSEASDSSEASNSSDSSIFSKCSRTSAMTDISEPDINDNIRLFNPQNHPVNQLMDAIESIVSYVTWEELCEIFKAIKLDPNGEGIEDNLRHQTLGPCMATGILHEYEEDRNCRSCHKRICKVCYFLPQAVACYCFTIYAI
ncbi:hypothetical protein NHQ30_001445, partial [Ciborinia camelliae]